MKRLCTCALALLLLAGLLTGCGSSQEPEETGKIFTLPAGYKLVEDVHLSFQVYLPQDMIEDNTLVMQNPWIMFGDLTQAPEKTETSPEAQTVCYYLPSKGEFPLFGVMRYEASKWDDLIKKGMTPAQITGEETAEEIGRQNQMVYLFTRPEADVTALSQAEQEAYAQLQNNLPSIRDSILLEVGAGMTLNTLPEFSVPTLTGETADNSIFEGHKITMVNIWGTFCSPCVQEMPMLEQLNQSLGEDVQLVGLICDIVKGDTAKALEIVADTGVTYPNLVAEGSLMDYLVENVYAYPTTIFVDAEGRIIGDAVIGARSQENYAAILADRLAQVG